MSISCLIVDDELLARRLLTDYVSKVPALQLVGTCASALEAQTVLQNHQIDLLFLDIQMPELTGIGFLQSLTTKPATIFTTAYTEYALKGYELAVLDYLVKPISFERFFQAAQRAIEYVGQVKNASNDFIFVKSDYKIQKVCYADIDYIEAYGEYVNIFCGKEKIMTLASLSKLEETLPGQLFLRVHRSFIINFSKIDTIQGNTILIKGKEIPLSKSYREGFMRLVGRSQI